MTRFPIRSVSLVLLVSGLAAAPLALAHPSLVSSTPAADATVAPATEITLQFSEKVMPRATRIELSMDHGRMKMATRYARVSPSRCPPAATHCNGARSVRTVIR